MAHRFEIVVNGSTVVYNNYDDIPEQIERVISFDPDIPPEPHSDAQHHEIDKWPARFQRLMEKEYAFWRKFYNS